MTITDNEWNVIKDALEAQQCGCNPCGETMSEVADILEKYKSASERKDTDEND